MTLAGNPRSRRTWPISDTRIESSKVRTAPNTALAFPRNSLLDMFPRSAMVVIMAAAAMGRPASRPQEVRNIFR